ncbi:MAG: hypothetical protein RH860_00085 [Cytophagales bacterium]
MTTHTEKKKPDYYAYSVRAISEDSANWTKLGAAWNNKDGEGINIVLDGLPIDGKLTLRKPQEPSEAEPS